MSDERPPLLDQFRLYQTDDPAEARALMRDRFGLELITPDAPNFSVRSNCAELPNLQIFCSASASALSLLLPKSESTHVHLFLRGGCGLTTAEHRIEPAQGQAFICSEGKAARLDYQADYEELVLNIPRAFLDRTFAALTGFPPKCAIEFEPQLDPDDPRYRGFHDLLMLLAGRLDPAFSIWPQATLEQLEQACFTSLLFCSRHNLSHLLDASSRDEVPRHVRLAEHFAEVNADRDIGVDEMARASAVSVSTLTRAFLKYRGCTPAAFIKRTRLAHAKDLLESRAATTVVGVALRCGFTNPSRFGKDYTQVFGETPTETLRRLRIQSRA